MSSSDKPVEGVTRLSSIAARQAQLQRAKAASSAQTIEIEQVAAEKTMIECAEEALFNPLAMLKDAETLDKRHRRQELKSSQTSQEEDTEVTVIDDVTKIAEEFEQRNPEMHKRGLLNIKVMIFPDDSAEEILAKILKAYPDHYLADEAFDFLFETSDPNSKLGKNIILARHLLNERFGREIKAGRNIKVQAREFSRQGLGKPTALRDLYRDVTGNPREPLTLFEELIESYTFDKMKTVLQFILHSIGSDLKSKGPSISRGELSRLFTEARTMQAILGVFRFFFQRMRIIEGSFHRENLTLPKQINFELLAKLFVQLLAERYPSPDKILRLGALLGLSEELLAQIIIFTQYRDAMRGISPRLFKSEKHRQDLLATLIETIGELDELLEEEEEEEDDEDDEEDDEEHKPPGWSQKDTIE